MGGTLIRRLNCREAQSLCTAGTLTNVRFTKRTNRENRHELKHQRYTIIKLFDDVISKAEARMAWESEQQGERRKDIAKKLSVSERTLTQSYTHYKLIKTKRE